MTDLTPGSPEWNRLITASKVAAILGVSPWDSPRSVWHQMKGQTAPREQTEVMSRGHYLEPAILAWWRDQHPEFQSAHFATPQETFTLGDWAAATPDLTVRPIAPMQEGVVGRKILPPAAIVEAKSAAYDDDWGDPGTDVIPAYYLVQTYWQMHVSGIHRCYVPIITSRLRFAEYVVDYDAEIGADLETRMRAFYDTLAADEPPPLDDSVATFDVIRKLHPDIEPNAEVELTREQAVHLLDAVNEADRAEANLRRWKSEVIDAMGRAQYAVCEGVRVARRQPNKTGVSFVPLPQNLPLLTDQTEGLAS
jgi:putative phage-type endonuclease